MDVRERFLNFETAKGIYMIPAGLLICYVTWFHIQFVIQATGLLLGWYIFSEGLRKVWVNRIKEALKKEELITARVEATTPSVEVADGKSFS